MCTAEIEQEAFARGWNAAIELMKDEMPKKMRV